ncbi:MAG: hypothetical protein AAGF81_03845, partial [Pseudomonadota bacterium]
MLRNMVTLREFTAQHGIGQKAAEAPTAVGKMTRGRGARTNVSGRFETNKRLLFDDGWQSLEDQPAIKTEVFEEQPKALINKNSSPDLGFD